MRRVPVFSPLLLILLTSLMISCVSTKKYDELAFQKRQLEAEKSKLTEEVTSKDAMISTLREKETMLTQRESELASTKSQLAALQESQKDLMRKYDELLSQSNEVLDNASQEKAALSEELSAKQQELDQKERELRFLEMKLQSQEENLVTLQEDVRVRERKLLELTEELNARDSMMKMLRASIDDALRGFSDADLTVSEFNGKVYVSLSQNLLFAKGSNVIDQQGLNAIRKLANVLKDNPEIQINVEGHTDSDGSPAKNWDLSVTRATSVVKALTGAGLDPGQVTASGRGLYYPKVPNDTEDNKAINRRTEIILSPNLDALYSLLE